jgi:hypothetical protein
MQNLEQVRAISNLPKEQRARNRKNREEQEISGKIAAANCGIARALSSARIEAAACVCLLIGIVGGSAHPEPGLTECKKPGAVFARALAQIVEIALFKKILVTRQGNFFSRPIFR